MPTFGLNISGGEFGGSFGTHGAQYEYPTYNDLKFYAEKGVDFIRLPIRWERVQSALDGPLDLSGDIALIKQVLVDAASLGMDVIIDLHNYGRYKAVETGTALAIGAEGGPTIAQFADFWKKMAIEFKDYPALTGYDLMNEPHDMPTDGTWKAAAQAATDAIRTIDMSNIIYVEGNGWSAAHKWLVANSDLIINDPAGRIVYQAHGYYDDNNSGTYNESYEGEEAYPMVGVDRLTPFVEWLKANNLKGMIGEFGVPSSDPRWLEVQKNALDYLQANNVDATAWGGGVGWSPNYHHYTAEPGAPDSPYMDLLQAYFNKYRDPFDTTPPPAPEAPTVAVNDVAVKEASGFMTFTVKRSGDLSLAASVDYAAADVSATAGMDYTLASGTVNFAVGETTALVTIILANDTEVENLETLVLNLSNGVNVTISDAQGTGTIKSDDTGVDTPPGFPDTPTIEGTDGNDKINAGTSTVDYIDAKGGDDTISGVFSKDFIDGGAGSDTISYHWGSAVDVDLMRASQLGGDANGDVLVRIENIKGSNKNDVLSGDNLANHINGLGGQDVLTGRGGSDTFYFHSAVHANNDLVTDYTFEDRLDFSEFNPTFLSITNDGVNTTILGDSNADGVGDFSVILRGVHSYINGVSSGSQPPPPTVAISDVTADEATGILVFTIARSGDLSGASSLNYTTADGTATAGSDYMAATGMVTFAAGEATATISVQIIDDTLTESPETFSLNLSSGANVIITDGSGTATINSEDVAGPIRGTSASETINGTTGNDTIYGMDGNDTIIGGAGADYIHGGNGNDAVSYHTSGAAVDVDLTRAVQQGGDAQGDQLVSAGHLTGSAHNDALAGDHTANNLNGGGGRDVLTGRAGSDRFMFNSAADADGDVITDFAVGFDKLDLRSIDANVALAGNQTFTWLDSGAFTNKAGQLREYDLAGKHFVAGDTNGDGLADFNIEVAGTTNLASTDFVGTMSSAPVASVPAVKVNDVTANEDAGLLVFSITRSGDLSGVSSVNYATADSTATAGSDYAAANGTVNFAAGQATATVSVQILNDVLIESPETFSLNLSGATNATISDGTGTGTINSEDVAGRITGTNASETINGTVGSDSIYALDGNDTIIGSAGADYIHGGNGSDTVTYLTSGAAVDVDLTRAVQQGGDAQGDQLVSAGHLTGSAHNDTLAGDQTANTITGGGGRDILTGRGGSDRFMFNSAADADGDVITDFAVGFDKLNLRSIDANVALAGDQSFAWLDSGAFTGKAGQLREYDLSGKHFVAGDTNGDGFADFIIEVAGATNLTSTDFLL